MLKLFDIVIKQCSLHSILGNICKLIQNVFVYMVDKVFILYNHGTICRQAIPVYGCFIIETNSLAVKPCFGILKRLEVKLLLTI